MKLDRWNTETREYEPYKVPEDWNCVCYSTKADAEINCASCGKKMRYGSSLTSREIHESHGFGYMICPDCYQQELYREQMHWIRSAGRKG